MDRQGLRSNENPASVCQDAADAGMLQEAFPELNSFGGVLFVGGTVMLTASCLGLVVCRLCRMRRKQLQTPTSRTLPLPIAGQHARHTIRVRMNDANKSETSIVHKHRRRSSQHPHAPSACVLRADSEFHVVQKFNRLPLVESATTNLDRNCPTNITKPVH
ncbi:hypothetical protein T4D_3975 [Trichinella pseudospiralis]|uniref:Uncharacterized protein n=1 Tax=Trichinella pseudospiralis TaxID=6337 RepID=A0A0V1FWD0_TRIPS|nr:hypothetical protein T4D_3975 [Trichinella pseudospiralis]